MEIVDDSDPDWWVARHLLTGETGHIPRNYVALQSSIESEEWVFFIAFQNFSEFFVVKNNAKISVAAL